MRIEYHPAVAEELEEVRDFYEQQSVGLGRAFVDEFEATTLHRLHAGTLDDRRTRP